MSVPMDLLIIALGTVILAAFSAFAAEYGVDSRDLSDETRHLSFTVGLS